VKPRTILFWIHLMLGIATGLARALMAGTAVIMAFADTYLDVREYGLRQVENPANAEPLSLATLALRVNAKHPETPMNRVGFDGDPKHAYEFYYDQAELDSSRYFSGAAA